MGDMADDALDRVEDEYIAYLKARDEGPQALYDGGFCDEQGWELWPREKVRVVGEGPCPKCGKPTVLRNGKFGEFYGCSDFPKCKGSRNREG